MSDMLNSRDIDRLRPDVAANCRKWLDLCKANGLNVLVTQTVRDKEYQEYLYAQGRTRPGSIVTNGRTPTFHSDKAGLAFDFCIECRGSLRYHGRRERFCFRGYGSIGTILRIGCDVGRFVNIMLR